MSVTVKKNGAPTYDQGAVVQPEYTYDNWKAQMEWNKEIANNKQGYLAVDIMPMKDFYDAGGYSFVNDYRAELDSVDAAYDRSVPGYGVQGEQMAGAGLTGSGFTDYMSGQAYAARVGGQALARQNAMANSNSFRAAYNQYVQQQLQKREDNLLSVVEKAYAAGVPLANFTTIATRLGIPQADAERGYSMLEAYYSGFGTSSQKYPIPDANGSTDSATGSSTAPSVEDYTIDKLDTQDAAIAGSYAQQVAQAVQEGMSVEQALNLIKGQYEDYGGVITSAIKNHVNATLVSGIEGTINQGGYVPKEMLDSYAARGVFGAEGKESAGYKAILEKVQGANYGRLQVALDSGEIEDYAAFLQGIGVDTADATTDNVAEMVQEALDEMHKNGDISDEDYKRYNLEVYEEGLSGVNSKKGMESFSQAFFSDTAKGRLDEQQQKEILDKITVSTKSERTFGGIINSRVMISLPNGEELSFPYQGAAVTRHSLLEASTDGAKVGDMVSENGRLYMFLGKKNEWQQILVSGGNGVIEDLLVEKMKKSN